MCQNNNNPGVTMDIENIFWNSEDDVDVAVDGDGEEVVIPDHAFTDVVEGD